MWEQRSLWNLRSWGCRSFCRDSKGVGEQRGATAPTWEVISELLSLPEYGHKAIDYEIKTILALCPANVHA